MNQFTRYSTPLGMMILQANNEGLLGAWFEDEVALPEHWEQTNHLGQSNDKHPILRQTLEQLTLYFSGKLRHFDIPLAAKGTVFQQQVWQALSVIPYGETWSYQQLAIYIGNSKAVRAVGLANSKNPISIIVPCHRVIGKNGALTGYAGGIERKAYLLGLEGKK